MRFTIIWIMKKIIYALAIAGLMSATATAQKTMTISGTTYTVIGEMADNVISNLEDRRGFRGVTFTNNRVWIFSGNWTFSGIITVEPGTTIVVSEDLVFTSDRNPRFNMYGTLDHPIIIYDHNNIIRTASESSWRTYVRFTTL